ncbi:MAG: sugar phosphate isomerase/epimerase [Rhodothermales bacterium]|nr:sugar phosphate isomerase/epimerase [Rhodothermales bacterium]MBO6778053.1 sugar phosphate isomerase/epimerase [Rhodothermales bacterium]
MNTRRHFLKAGATLAAGALLGGWRPSAGGALEHVRLGVASYSLRELSRREAIAGIKACGAQYVNIKSFHLDYGASAQEIAEARRQFADAGIEIVGGGLIPFYENDDDTMRASFEYARAAGFPVIVAGPNHAVLPRLERFAVEYDIKVAIHNHGPEDNYFPAPSDALALIEGMDLRMGVCVDVGHTARTGRDVVAEIAAAGDRLHDVHMKDLADFSSRDSQCVVGDGLMPVPAIFRQLEAMRYPGYVNLEYEIEAANPVPGMQRSFAYMRGVLAGME